MFSEYLAKNDLRSQLVPREKRGLFPTARNRAAWESLPGREAILRWGDEAKAGYPDLPATAYLAYARSGDRQAFEKPYFRRRTLLMGAALAECAAHDGTYLDAVVDGLWHLCEETSWVISAHNGAADGRPGHEKETPLPDARRPYIDLFAAQTAATLAYTVYLLSRELDAVAPLLRKRVRLELETRVFAPFMERDDFWWMGFVRKNLNNWTPWILSNVIDAFLLFEEDDDRLAAALARAMGMLDRYLACQPADGGCDEGCGYWNMAGGSLLDCLESLRLATGGQADFYGEPLIRNIALFPLAAHIAGEWYWNFADCDAKPMLDGERVYVFGLRTGNPALAALGAGIASSRTDPRPRDTPQMSRVLNALFTPIPEADAARAEETKAARTVILPRLQVFAFEHGDFYAAVKGGHNGESHNHNDVGSLIVYYKGEPCLIDAGNRVYTAKTFSGERYTLWNTRAAYHNVPMVGGVEQREGEGYHAEFVESFPDGTQMELAHAYPPEAGIDRFTRTVSVGERVTVTDELTLAGPKGVEWVWMFRAKPEAGAGELIARDVRMTFPAELAFSREEIPVTDARMARSFPGSLYRVTLAAAPAARHRARFEFSGVEA